ncbi:hypothetical protein FHT98_5079 [Bosea sp. AK1]|uniref:AbiJ-NTD4 domain-containing protein n=1 Tax=Bosea sp. AK1 TaxID=2587160 RepID=UPI00114F92C0|nr:hypothetical protein [Bosea sp. AK1]TQI65212.1 hypothetical protein FHT98_5079 [Bosea sp. AK1]
MSRFFSDRHGYDAAVPEITTREDAPESLRFGVVNIARNVGMKPSSIRNVVCSVLFEAPNPTNWSEYPNIWEEALGLVEQCEWFKVYDIAEALWRALYPNDEWQDLFEAELNRLFREKGIGWELKSSHGIVFRGDALFTAATTEAAAIFEATGRKSAAGEIREALKDISRRPHPDRTGAVQHSMAALECAARDVTGDPSATLGKLIPRLAVPRPLDDALTKLWGYASENGRHIREGTNPSPAEAELVVSVACAVSVFLIQRDGEVRAAGENHPERQL